MRYSPDIVDGVNVSDPLWQALFLGTDCPLCPPRRADGPHWLKVATLPAATLYLDRNQTYRGHCQLVFDGRHVVGLENLTLSEYSAFTADVGRAGRAIARAVRPDLMNYACLGNVVPHLHAHLVPRYRTDPRWGGPIYTSNLEDMLVTRLTEGEYQETISAIRAELAADASREGL